MESKVYEVITDHQSITKSIGDSIMTLYSIIDVVSSLVLFIGSMTDCCMIQQALSLNGIETIIK